jgi:hypothetical protein
MAFLVNPVEDILCTALPFELTKFLQCKMALVFGKLPNRSEKVLIEGIISHEDTLLALQIQLYHKYSQGNNQAM